MKNDIRNYNDKEQFHGYQELYFFFKIHLRNDYKNGKEIGYEEWHSEEQTNYYIR